jgi:hypothetical protein
VRNADNELLAPFTLNPIDGTVPDPRSSTLTQQPRFAPPTQLHNQQQGDDFSYFFSSDRCIMTHFNNDNFLHGKRKYGDDFFREQILPKVGDLANPFEALWSVSSSNMQQ